MPRGISFRIFYPDGTPDGLRLLEKSNWTGHGLLCPRPLFPEARRRDEFARTGIYVLLGPPDEGELPEVYIGEGDPIRPRLESHQREKDFWTTAIAFTSKDANLNKAHVQYLESRLVELARTAKRCKLGNAHDPQLPNLSEADTADTETFLEEMLLSFPVLGVSVFEQAEQASARVTPMLVAQGKGARANGYESSGGFVVQKGSTAAMTETASVGKNVRQLRAELLANGVLVQSAAAFEFAQDYEFSSPSLAASVVLGRSANGRIEWATVDGRSLKAIQESV